jgi:hypothetical protein
MESWAKKRKGGDVTVLEQRNALARRLLTAPCFLLI